MVYLAFVLLFTSYTFAQSPENEVLIRSFSEVAETSRLTEVVEMASRNTENITPSVDCDEPRKFVMVGVSGFGTGENGKGYESGVHDNLPNNERISTTLKITHSTSKKRLQEIVNSICGSNSPSSSQRPGLMIMANSWGAGAATRLSEMYQKTCKEPVELFIMVDGVSKPIGSFHKLPSARRCINYYQRLSTIKGDSIEGCENHDLSDICGEGGGVANCHITIEWDGSAQGARKVLSSLAN